MLLVCQLIKKIICLWQFFFLKNPQIIIILVIMYFFMKPILFNCELTKN